MSEKNKKLSLKDFEIRYRNIRKSYPSIESCSVEGCNNTIDITEGMGKDTSCAYHRLLFDYWSCEVCDMDALMVARNVRRHNFKSWMDKMGKEWCDKKALEMALEPINWKC